MTRKIAVGGQSTLQAAAFKPFILLSLFALRTPRLSLPTRLELGLTEDWEYMRLRVEDPLVEVDGVVVREEEVEVLQPA